MTNEQLKELAEYNIGHYGEYTDRCKLARALLIEMERFDNMALAHVGYPWHRPFVAIEEALREKLEEL